MTMRALSTNSAGQVHHHAPHINWPRWLAIILAILVLLACTGPVGGM